MTPAENSLIYGPTGSGKTRLIYSLAREALDIGSLVYLVSTPSDAPDDERDALLIRVTGQGLQAPHNEMLRRLATGETTPPIVILVDDFQKRMARERKPRNAARDDLQAWQATMSARDLALWTLARLAGPEGREAGVQVIIASSESGGRWPVAEILNGLPGRVLLTARGLPSEASVSAILGDDHSDAALQMLDRNGPGPGTGVSLVNGQLAPFGLGATLGSPKPYSANSIAAYARQMTLASPTPADLVIVSLVYLIIVGTGISEPAASAGVSRDQVKLLELARQGQPLHRIAASLVIPRGLAEAIPGPDVVEGYESDLGALSIRLDRPLTDESRLSLAVLGVHAFGVPLHEAVALVEAEPDAILQNMLDRPLVREWIRLANRAVGDD